MTTPPRWLDRLANAVAAEMLTPNVTTPDVNAPVGLAPIGCHFHADEDGWEVAVFVSKTETVGGPLDGRMAASPFAIDLERLRERFDTVRAMHWQAQPLGEGDELGAHLTIEGTYEGHEVVLRVLAAAPDRFEPGRTIDIHRNEVRDRW
jgi:hypothetical protein